MRPSILDELSFAGYRAFRQFIPDQRNREPLTWGTVPNAFIYMLPYLFMAYLARRADTYPIRLLFLPTVIATTIRCTFQYSIESPELAHLDWVRGLAALATIAKALNFALTKNGRFRIGETKLPRINETLQSDYSTPAVDSNEDVLQAKIHRQPFLPLWLRDALELGLPLRGVGWDYGRGLFVPPINRSLQKGPFLKATALSILQYALLLDFCDSLVKLYPGVGPHGGSLFLPNLPLYIRYTLSTIVHALAGTIIIASVRLGYELCAWIAVGFLDHAPLSWPPILNSPWAATSLHDFWARRWHQALRHVFFVYGGYPGRWIGGRPGMVFGVFLASGLFHELGIYVAGKGFDHRVSLFFVLQVVGIFVEEAWKKLWGKPVGGLSGRLWTALWILGLGQICTDAWLARGVGGAILSPSSLSPTKRLLWPILKGTLHSKV
ncbi:hypothetical protein CERSUDRAFT_113744 [Gelatoporia subvermispora B]|uniref:Wax synthase domain-containing protein n=1 Tax=Ceriporiopsis subvermispora (strain B) TaxID=914234 RepID=M2RIE0_CERS8|nr:hypothetical protein CERSUDRAFT_113744 [Gelatoporia subvermispora B]